MLVDSFKPHLAVILGAFSPLLASHIEYFVEASSRGLYVQALIIAIFGGSLLAVPLAFASTALSVLLSRPRHVVPRYFMGVALHFSLIVALQAGSALFR